MKVILLNGPSSAGKSSISRELQKAMCNDEENNTIIVSLDDYLIMKADEPIWEDDVFEIMPQMCNDIIQALQQGNNIIIDHVITSARIYDSLDTVISECDIVIKVLVKCNIEILRKREIKRGDRYIGSAEASLKYLYSPNGYDICIDSGEINPVEAASLIAAKVI